MEQGRQFGLASLSHDSRAALTTLQRAADARGKDWPKFTRQAAEFHLRNARAWASAAAGEDLTAQIDPGFAMGPEAFLAAAP